MTPAVTVALAAYNREKYIGVSIESVLAQSFEDFELLIVDDCSTDATAAIARDYASRDPRVRVVVNEANLGQFPNRNRAASLARGRLLKFHDSDDVMYPHCLEVMVRLLDAEPHALCCLSTGLCWPGGPCPMLSTPRMSFQREFLGYGMFNGGPSSALFRREAFISVGGFEVLGPHSDYLFWLRCCQTESIVLAPADLFWYRVHSGQHLQQPEAAKDSIALAPATWAALNDPLCPLTETERRQAKRNVCFSVAKKVYADLRGRALRRASQRVLGSGLSLGDWIRYLRRPRRGRLAGTPLDVEGDYIVPDWVIRREQKADRHA
jgi:hypothetical protein